MSAQGWLQIGFYLAVLTALTPLLGAYMARVYTGQPLLLERVLGPARAPRLPAARPGGPDRAGLEGLRQDHDRVQRGLLRRALRGPADPGDPAVQPRGVRLGHLGRLLQHHRLVHHQHQLAVLRRRDHPLLLLPDGRPHRPELRLGGGGHGGARRRDQGLRQPRLGRAGELLARRHPDAALHPPADLVHRRPDPRLAGSDPDPRGSIELPDRDRRRAEPRARARPPRRSRSSSSAPTAAASSTSTAPTRSRTRPSSRTSSRCSSSC